MEKDKHLKKMLHCFPLVRRQLNKLEKKAGDFSVCVVDEMMEDPSLYSHYNQTTANCVMSMVLYWASDSQMATDKYHEYILDFIIKFASHLYDEEETPTSLYYGIRYVIRCLDELTHYNEWLMDDEI